MSSPHGVQITYAALMRDQECIRVPMLQRDYAQGRADQHDVREGFLAALERALKGPIGDPELPLNLDFIYGSLEGDDDARRFAPLDGQQRLTTLFLLHWFLAWQDNEWAQFGQMFRGADGNSRFTYKVRQSSREFFDKLVAFEPSRRPQELPSISSLITDQPWYFRNWRLDPTVQSVLTMLDAIHRRFSGSAGLFARLTDTEHPAITFQLLLLENFGLTDDLYIKMNARGKPLTAFENFKAQYEHSLTSQFAEQTRRLGEHDYSVAKFVGLRMDTAWADFLWPHRDKTTNLCDGVMMNLLRVLALVTRAPEDSAYLQDVALLRDENNPASYSAFQLRGWLHEEFTEVLIAVLETWSGGSIGQNAFRPLLPDVRYFNEAAIFEKIRRDSVSLTLTEMTQFAAYVLFIRHHSGSVATPAFHEWMRVVRNLAVNTPIERADQLRTAAQGVRELLPKAADVLNHLVNLGDRARVSGFYQPQVVEEQTKAGLILHHEAWRPLIDRAEQHGYFVGQIDFLCDFSGANAQRKVAPDFRWGDTVHRQLQKRFQSYLTKAEAMFSAGGLKDDGQHRWTRALLVAGDYLLPAGPNYSLLADASTEPASWKRLLRTGAADHAAENSRRPFLKTLWDKLEDAAPLPPQLEGIIASASGLSPWIDALVRTPSAISFCRRRMIRRHSDTDVMLLSKSTLGGDHAQLFEFRLHEELTKTSAGQRLGAFKVASYDHGYDTQLRTLRLSYQRGSRSFYFSLYFERDQFRIQIESSALEQFPELKQLLTQSAGFVPTQEDGYWLVKSIARTDIMERLSELGGLLAALATQPSDS